MTSETQHKSTALIITVFLHLMIILFLFFYILKTPNPPFGGGQGVVLNLGFVDEGTGEVQTLNEPNDSKIVEENKPNEEANEIIPTPKSEETDPTPNLDKAEEALITGEEETKIQSEPKPETKTEKKEKKPEQENETKVAQKPPVEKSEIKPEKKVNTKALYGQTGTSTEGGNNNGDKAGKVGDQGNPQGDINAKALYGKMGEGGEGSGGSGGTSLDMAGWKWEKIPKVKDEDEDENGKIVFQITIDDQGEIISIKTLEKTVGPSVEKLYRDAVEKLTFTKTDNKIPTSTSTGKITFIIRSK